MTWKMFGHDVRNRYFHVGKTERFVKCFGDDPIVPVTVSILTEGRHEDDAYYGWQDAGEYDKPPEMIWPHWKSFNICFTYGAKAEMDRGKGRIVKLQISPTEPSKP